MDRTSGTWREPDNGAGIGFKPGGACLIEPFHELGVAPARRGAPRLVGSMACRRRGAPISPRTSETNPTEIPPKPGEYRQRYSKRVGGAGFSLQREVGP